jgi:hypothetical protein
MKSKIVFLLLLLLPGAATAFAQDVGGTCGENLTWTYSNGTLTISGTGDMTDDPWYLYRSSIETVIIGDGVTNIRNEAFSRYNSLASVTIGNSVTSIGDYAFRFCSSLPSIVIPNSVTSIGSLAFYNTAWLSNQKEGLVYIGNMLYTYGGVMPLNTSITIREGTLGIADYAFSSCTGLTSVIIPNSVTNIGICAFNYCSSLASVTIGNGVTSIGSMAFYYCSRLTSVTIGNSVASIGSYAFGGCSRLSTVNFNAENCTSMVSLYPIRYVFFDCEALTTVNIGNEVKTIPDYAFYYCSRLTSVTIPNSVTSIGGNAFEDCFGLTSVTIGNSVTSIGSYAFHYCSRLTSVTIPNSVTSIGDKAFDNCQSLTSVTNLNPVPQSIRNSGVFSDVNIGEATLYVPAESVALYKAASVWKDFGTITALVPSAIDAPAAASAIRVYSHPATGSFHIEGLTAPAQVTVINTGGQIVWRQTVAGDGSLGTGHLPQGVYLVNVNGQTFKIIN